MSAPLSEQLFHGTRAVIKGSRILPLRGAAWATDSKEAAEEYGKTKFPQGKLGPLKVYAVEPTESMSTTEHPYRKGVKIYGSSTGFKIVGEA